MDPRFKILSEELQILKGVEAVLDAPEKWTKGALARDAAGTSIDEDGSGATGFCMLGALNLVHYRTRRMRSSVEVIYAANKVSHRLQAAAQARGFQYLAGFNDHPCTTFENVRELLAEVRTQIETAQKEL